MLFKISKDYLISSYILPSLMAGIGCQQNDLCETRFKVQGSFIRHILIYTGYNQ